jgi:hypothetical protein
MGADSLPYPSNNNNSNNILRTDCPLLSFGHVAPHPLLLFINELLLIISILFPFPEIEQLLS